MKVNTRLPCEDMYRAYLFVRRLPKLRGGLWASLADTARSPQAGHDQRVRHEHDAQGQEEEHHGELRGELVK